MAELDSKADATNTLLKATKVGPKEVMAFIIVTLSVAFVAFHMYAGMYGHPEAHFYRSIHLTVILMLCFVFYPLKRASWMEKVNCWTIIDVICVALVLTVELYYLWDINAFEYRQISPNKTDIIMGVILWFLVLEATRRALGWPMVIIAVAFTFQALYSDKMFWIFYGPKTSLKVLALDMYMQEGGIYGMPLGTIASFVVLFMIFSALLEETGTGRTFIDLALSLFGAKVGGPAKASVAGSAFFATLSGSSVANVVATGPFTIPLMKRVGFKGTFAAGLEACASTGGMFTPPILGATAFVMAAYLGIPYFTVALAALIPSVCYYVALFANVDFYSRKNNLKPLPKEEMPSTKAVLKKGFHLLIPIITLIYWLASGYTASLACFWSIIALFTISFFKKSSRPKAENIVRVCESAVRATVITSLACAAAGIIVSSTTLSGVGLKLGAVLVDIAGDRLWLACVIATVFAIIVGLGLTTTAIYIIMAVTVIPPLIKLGILPIAAHMYAFFWGVLSNITPPVAIASFAAAGIAKTGPMETAVNGFYIALPGMFVFACFLYNPALLFVGEPLDIAINAFGCLVGVVCCSAAIQGYAYKKINILFRLALILIALAVLSPRWDYSIIGALFGIMIIWHNYISAKKNPPFDADSSSVAAGRAG